MAVLEVTTLGEGEQTVLQTLTMEQPVGEVVDISLAEGEVVVEVDVEAQMADEEGRLEKYC